MCSIFFVNEKWASVVLRRPLSGIVSHCQLLSTILHFAAQPDGQRQRYRLQKDASAVRNVVA